MSIGTQLGRTPEITSRSGFVKTEIALANVLSDQPPLWSDQVLLDEDFFRALREHPVPVSETALRAIGPRSLVIDIYIWLVYRLHVVKGEMKISWPALHAQFGAGVTLLKHFRPYFTESLRLALAAYPAPVSQSMIMASYSTNRAHR